MRSIWAMPSCIAALAILACSDVDVDMSFTANAAVTKATGRGWHPSFDGDAIICRRGGNIEMGEQITAV